MAEDWLADVRKYDANADEGAVAGIVRYCGIALRNRDSSLVSFSDSKETARVRENYLKKKLALTDDDATLDQAIARVGERMKADRTKNRVTVYYLLANEFGRLDLFRGKGKAAAGAAVAGAAAVGAAEASAKPRRTRTTAPVAAAPAAAAMATPAAAAAQSIASERPAPAAPIVRDRPPVDPAPRPAPATAEIYREDRTGFIGFGLIAAAVVIGVVLFAAVVGGLAAHRPIQEAAAAPPADFSQKLPEREAPLGSTAAQAPAATAAVPAGAGVVAATRDTRPMLSVYFDTGKAAVTPQFGANAGPLLAYLSANPQAKVAISGYNDPSGNAAANAALSKQRAQNVQAALVAAGLDAARATLVKPADTTTTNVTPEEARRVEVTVAG